MDSLFTIWLPSSRRPFINVSISSSHENKKKVFSSAVMAHYVNYCTSFSCNFPVTDKQISAAAAAEMLRYLHSSSQRFIPQILKGKRGLELGRFFNVKIINGGSDLGGSRGRAGAAELRNEAAPQEQSRREESQHLVRMLLCFHFPAP